jgi:hypothetical protein
MAGLSVTMPLSRPQASGVCLGTEACPTPRVIRTNIAVHQHRNMSKPVRMEYQPNTKDENYHLRVPISRIACANATLTCLAGVLACACVCPAAQLHSLVLGPSS